MCKSKRWPLLQLDGSSTHSRSAFELRDATSTSHSSHRITGQCASGSKPWQTRPRQVYSPVAVQSPVYNGFRGSAGSARSNGHRTPLFYSGSPSEIMQALNSRPSNSAVSSKVCRVFCDESLYLYLTICLSLSIFSFLYVSFVIVHCFQKVHFVQLISHVCGTKDCQFFWKIWKHG